MKKYQTLPYILLLGFFFGTNLVAARFSLGQFSSNTFLGLRLSIVSFGYILLYLFSKKNTFPRDKKIWLHGGVFGLIGMAIPMACFIGSLNYQSSGVTSLLATLNAPATIVLSHFLLKDEKLNRKKLIGVLIAFAGAGLVLLRGESGLAEFAKADWRGYAMVGVGILGTACGLIYARHFLKDGKDLDVVSIRIFTATIIIVPLAFLTDGFDLSRVQLSGWLALAYSVIFCTFTAFWLEFHIIRRFGASQASQASYLIPLVATLLGALLLDEQITLTIIAGMAAIFVGLYLLNRK